MFSFTPKFGAVPILRVEGGPIDGQRVWLLPEPGEEERTAEIDSMRCECGKLFKRRVMLRKHRTTLSQTRQVPICPYRRKLGVMRERGVVPESDFDHYTLPEDSGFIVTPYEISDKDGNPSYNQRLYIVGASGCGKSRWAGNWLREYQSSHPERTVAAFCQAEVDKDPAYEGVELEHLDPCDEELADVWSEPTEVQEGEAQEGEEGEAQVEGGDDGWADLLYDDVSLDELDGPSEDDLTEEQEWSDKMSKHAAGGKLHGRICLFDDIDQMTGDAKVQVYRLLGEAVQMGRKAGIPVCFCNHNFTEGAKTKDILNSLTSMVIFPRNAPPKSLGYLLEKYAGLDNKTIPHLLVGNPKWLYIHRSYPNFFVTEKNIFSMNHLRDLASNTKGKGKAPVKTRTITKVIYKPGPRK